MWWRRLFSNRPTSDRIRRPVAVTLLAIMVFAASGRARVCVFSSPAQPFEIGRRTADQLLLNEVQPAYPPLARINYIRGHVRLLVTVDCNGRVESIHVLRGHPFLAIAALNAIQRWVYRPFVTRLGPARFQTTVDVNFSLLSPNVQNFPPQPEQFVARGVQPPRVASTAAPVTGSATVVRLRVLVNKKGRVVDSTPLSGTPAQFEAAKKMVARWKFEPAHWGNLSVPWYADVDVPVRSTSLSPSGAHLTAP